MAGKDLRFACDCGALTGTLLGVDARNGNRVDCYCTFCRDAEIYSGKPNPAPGPVALYQTQPFRVRFDSGQDQLAVFSFSPKGLLRWQAKCCGVTLFNTLRAPKIAFSTIMLDRLDDPSSLGPARTRASIQMPGGKEKNEGMGAAIWNLLSNALPARVTGKWKDTPFFDIATGQPVAEVYVVPQADRAALTNP